MPIKECICLHIGQAGCQIGSKLWELYCQEHGIDPDGRVPGQTEDLENTYESFFHETTGGQFVPRAIFVDTDPSSKDSLSGPMNKYRKLFHPDALVSAKRSCNSVFGEGGVMGREYMITDTSMDAIRKAYDLCENLQGFFVMHAVGGGCGSGLGCEILEKMRDEFPKHKIFQPLIYPSQNMANSIVEPYNCLLATHRIHEEGLCDLTMLMDNEAAYQVATKKLRIANPTFSHLNKIIAQIISACTTSLRFETVLNASLPEIVSNVVPQNEYRYTSVSFAPLRSRAHASHESMSTDAIVKELFEPYNTMCELTRLKNNRYLAACIMLRGIEQVEDDGKEQVDMTQILAKHTPVPDAGGSKNGKPCHMQPMLVKSAIDSISNMRAPKSGRPTVRFPPWVQGGFKVGVVGNPPVSPEGFEMAPTNRAGCMIANTTAIRQVFVRQYIRYLKLSHHQAYMHQFIAGGTEAGEFDGARETMRKIINMYEDMLQQCADAEPEGTMHLQGKTSRLESTAAPDDSASMHH